MTEAEEIAMIAAAFPPKPKCDAFADHARTMREEVIPAIERDLERQSRFAHYLRSGLPRRLWPKD